MGGACCKIRYEPIDCSGKTIIITGATAGIGRETAFAFARMRTENLILACRDAKKTEQVVQEIRQETKSDAAVFMELDLASLQSVVRFAEAFRQRFAKLDILICNAGMALRPRHITTDGFESQLQVNYLGHFLLTLLLKDLLHPGSRVVNVASVGHKFGVVDLTNMNGERSYKNFPFYGNSKLYQLMSTYDLAGRLPGVGFFAVHPGYVQSDIDKNYDCFWRCVVCCTKCIMRSPAEGAVTQIVAATSVQLANQSGLYLEDARPTRSAKLSYDKKLQQDLYDWSINVLTEKGFLPPNFKL